MSVARRCAVAGCCWAVALGTAPRTAAANDTETSAARADRLFAEGKAALQVGHYGEACPKLAESQSLDPGSGTLLALALCHEAQGLTASAWKEFEKVLEASALEQRSDRETLASAHLRRLDGRLSKVTVQVAGGTSLPAEVHVQVDGQDLPRDQWGQPVPMDRDRTRSTRVFQARAGGGPSSFSPTGGT